jgi:hypothetical protein
MHELQDLVLKDRGIEMVENEDSNQNAPQGIIEQVDGARLGKIADTTPFARGFMRNLGKRMSFSVDVDEFGHGLKRYDSQASLASFSSISSHYSVKSEFCSPNNAYGRVSI